MKRISLHCRKCGSSGIAVWEIPAADLSPDSKLISLSDGFYQRPLLGATSPEIICDHCGTGQPGRFSDIPAPAFRGVT